MDPNAYLEEIRQLVNQQRDADVAENSLCASSVDRLAELVHALDEWIAKGGFLPDAWKHKETNACT